MSVTEEIRRWRGSTVAIAAESNAEFNKQLQQNTSILLRLLLTLSRASTHRFELTNVVLGRKSGSCFFDLTSQLADH